MITARPSPVAALLTALNTWLHRVVFAVASWFADRLRTAADERERGDVPGWVMITLMSAGLVAVIWVLADDWLRQLFQQAVDRVSGP